MRRCKPTLNVQLLDEVLTQIDLKPETWRQDVWNCGTGHCTGGWAAVLSGWTPVEINSSRIQKDGVYGDTYTVARNALGLTDDQASCLFNGTNTREDLDLIIDAILCGAL